MAKYTYLPTYLPNDHRANLKPVIGWGPQHASSSFEKGGFVERVSKLYTLFNLLPQV